MDSTSMFLAEFVLSKMAALDQLLKHSNMAEIYDHIAPEVALLNELSSVRFK